MKNLFKRSEKQDLWNDANKASMGLVIVMVLFVIAMFLTN